MRFGIFYEHQNPRPWEGDRAEHKLMRDALEQVELADRVGFDYVWEVEHHFLEEYSHSSAPEVFLAAASQRTKRIRLGHGIIQLPPRVNHPARIAERVATLDLVSDGRVEFGSGESSSASELGGFLVERERKRDMWEDAIDAITRMFVEEPFAGWNSEFIQMPPRDVVPKPLQKPHPPLWVACSRRDTILLAARKGMGALTFAFVEPEEAGQWVEEYYALIESEECVPAGYAVNPNLAVVLPMMLHPDEETAIERGIDGAHFFGYSLAYYYGFGKHKPGQTVIWDEFQNDRDARGFAREIVTADAAPLGVQLMQQGIGSLRGAIGTPDQVKELVRRYQAVGVDQIIFVQQAGSNKHEHICESLELFAEHVMPNFTEGREEREKAKMERLAPAMEAAMGRRAAPRPAPPDYVVDEEADLKLAPKARHAPTGDGRVPRDVAGKAREAVERGGRAIFSRFVRGASERQLERRFGRRAVQRAIFTGMARQFVPDQAHGFEGDIMYVLERGTDGAAPHPPDHWTIRIEGDRASAIPSASPDPAVTLRLSLPDFIRVAADEVKPPELFFSERLKLEGDFEVAARLAEMFGQPTNF